MGDGVPTATISGQPVRTVGGWGVDRTGSHGYHTYPARGGASLRAPARRTPRESKTKKAHKAHDERCVGFVCVCKCSGLFFIMQTAPPLFFFNLLAALAVRYSGLLPPHPFLLAPAKESKQREAT